MESPAANEQGNAPANGQRGPTETVLAQGAPEDERRLTVRFSEFVTTLASGPDIDEGYLASLMAAIDLIGGIIGPPGADFGSAAPAAGAESEPLDKFGAVSDEALTHARTLIEAADDYEAFAAEGPPGADSQEIVIALQALTATAADPAREEISRTPPTPAPAAAHGFI